MSEEKKKKATITKNNASSSDAKKHNAMLAIGCILLAIIALFVVNEGNITLFREEEIEEVLSPADIQLYVFNDLTNANRTSIELWLMNIGDETATNISVFIRTRDQNGTILVHQFVRTTTMVLRADETCSGHLVIDHYNATTLFHTIEVSWDEGRNSYFKETRIPSN